ncbi:type I-C CRISPR-associated protein Cas8c/Csd1 [Mesorhizobium sp. CAU 1741]|uniref:type I-C CRISPR-associated protein Cas8c/Csd1 n=1 Tax=Mesorhizobium sp. CAU 1741 TaxID=3140366 RepID=UPI00325ACD85
MTILASLAKAYERLPDAPPFGYARVEVGFCIVLQSNGNVAFDPVDLRLLSGRKMRGPKLAVPAPLTQRTSGIKPNFLWDKSAYSLGVTSKPSDRTELEHAKFVSYHQQVLEHQSDEGFLALLAFLERWNADDFGSLNWADELVDCNIVFALESEYKRCFLHQRPAAIALWSDLMVMQPALDATCLVLGARGRIADSHPPIKGVDNAQSSGAFIVSFNDDAYQSYGHSSGDNAPVSEAAAFAYTTVLNRFLERDSGHRLQIGDASTVFWADASDMKAAADAEAIFAFCMDSGPQPSSEDIEIEDKVAARSIGDRLERIRQGRPLVEIAPKLASGVRFYVLGLAPNAARLSVRFYYADDFGVLVTNYQRFIADMRIEPPPRDGYPPLWRYLQETAVLGKRENVQPNLAGEWMRSILTGTNYPMTLMSSVLTRIRADGRIDALRAGILKALLIRNFREKAPVGFDPTITNRGYLLGRLFALYEEIQRAALGGKVNATIKDKFYGSASATPRKVFAVLDGGSSKHLAKIRKTSPGWWFRLDEQVRGIMDLMVPSDAPDKDPFPVALSAKEQAWFGLGYHHQRSEFFKKATNSLPEGENE